MLILLQLLFILVVLLVVIGCVVYLILFWLDEYYLEVKTKEQAIIQFIIPFYWWFKILINWYNKLED